MRVWFTSDTHFAHRNIIEYCGRPFADVEAMDAAMIANWQAVVGPTDLVYHLGDFAFGPVENIGRYLSQLPGRIVLIRGNHDRRPQAMRRFPFAAVDEEVTIQDVGVLGEPWPAGTFRLSHRPVNDPTATACLHGHVHEKWARQGNRINVGVDVRGFRPVSLEDLLAATVP